MNDIIKALLRLFQAVCFGAAGFMSYSQIRDYASNRDLSIVSVQNFNHDPMDTYPTISVCAFLYSQLFTNFDKIVTNISAYEYWWMLNGDINVYGDFHKIQFDDARFDFMDDSKTLVHFAVHLKNYTVIDSKTPPTWQSVHRSGPMTISYQDHNVVCLSKRLIYMHGVILQRAKFMLKPDSNKILALNFYIHEDGQLLKALANTQLSLTMLDLNEAMDKTKEVANNNILFFDW